MSSDLGAQCIVLHLQQLHLGLGLCVRLLLLYEFCYIKENK